MKMPSEHEEQTAFVNWFRHTYKDVLILAIPNGGYRNKYEAMRLKKEGVYKGVPDLYIPAFKTWVEMKTTTGQLSKAQKEVIEYLQSIGDTVIVGFGFLDAMEKIKWIKC